MHMPRNAARRAAGVQKRSKVKPTAEDLARAAAKRREDEDRAIRMGQMREEYRAS